MSIHEQFVSDSATYAGRIARQRTHAELTVTLFCSPGFFPEMPPGMKDPLPRLAAAAEFAEEVWLASVAAHHRGPDTVEEVLRKYRENTRPALARRGTLAGQYDAR